MATLARTVLVVEDSDLDTRMLEMGLQSSIARSNVVCVKNTTEAEEYLFPDGRPSSAPDLVVLDVRVPPAGGVALLRRLRSNDSTKQVPVLMISGQLREQDIRELYYSGANSYIDKPMDKGEFVAMVSTAARYWLSLNMGIPRGI